MGRLGEAIGMGIMGAAGGMSGQDFLGAYMQQKKDEMEKTKKRKAFETAGELIATGDFDEISKAVKESDNPHLIDAFSKWGSLKSVFGEKTNNQIVTGKEGTYLVDKNTGDFKKLEGIMPEDSLSGDDLSSAINEAFGTGDTQGIDEPEIDIEPRATGLGRMGRGAAYSKAVEEYGTEKTDKIIGRIQDQIQAGKSLGEVSSLLREAGINPELFLKSYR